MKYRRIWLAVAVFVAILAAEWLWLNSGQPERVDDIDPATVATPNVSVIDIGGPFSFVDATGAPVTEETFHGRFVVLFFGYTACPDVCPTTLQVLAEALELLGPAASDLQPLFVSLDPEHDGPAELAAYTDAFDPRILGVTATPAELRRVTQAYHVYFARYEAEDDPDDYIIDHSAYLYLLGPDGRLRSYFPHQITPADLAERLATAMQRWSSPSSANRPPAGSRLTTALLGASVSAATPAD
jgi:protein SCO1/2